MCEDSLNEKFDIRREVTKLIKTNEPTNFVTKNADKNPNPKVLLIDEVDVFFNDDFLGNIYVPSAKIKHESITDLFKYIWAMKNKGLSFTSVKTSKEYQNCINYFTNWSRLIDEQVKQALADLATFQTHTYVVDASKGKIGYKEQDGVSFKIVYGYKTLFAYFFEHQLGKITQKSLEENIFIQVNCGCFSYSEIPNYFDNILGVTGTLENLSEARKRLIKEKYHIKFETIMPSVYGGTKIDFKRESYILISNKDDYFLRLVEEIEKRLPGIQNGEFKRAVLVFFETEDVLYKFYNSSPMSHLRDKVNFLFCIFSFQRKIYVAV